MTFIPQNIVDATATGDSVRDGIIKIDDNVSDAYAHLNTLNTTAAGKINRSDRDVPNGVCPLDENVLVPLDNIPTIPLSKLEIDPRIPIGAIIKWPLDTAPTGYLHCDGSELSSAYTELIAVLVVAGKPFGTGSSGRPSIPDYRGYFFRGYDPTGSVDPDGDERTLGDIQLDTMKSHSHSFYTSMSLAYTGGYALSFVSSVSPTSGTLTTTTDGSISGEETRPINKSVMYCIKYE